MRPPGPLTASRPAMAERPANKRSIEMPSPITDLAAYRMRRQRPIAAACRWAEAIEEATIANLRAAGVIQRLWLRLFTGA